MMKIITQIGKILSWMFIPESDEVISKEARKILSNPIDRQKYRQAVEDLRHNPEPVTVMLTSGEKITLIS